MIDQLMKEAEKLGKKIDQTPDYPIQLYYKDGGFSAMYEPNFASVIMEEADTAEKALTQLIKSLKKCIKKLK